MQFNEENDWVPQLGMEFQAEEQAWQFWNNYSGKMGFGARRCYSHNSRVDSVLTSVSFVCSNQGFRKKDKQDVNTKNPQAESRTGCKVRLNVKFIRETNSFRVVEFVSDHNHALQKPEACYMIASQRKVTEVQQCDIDLADQSGIRPKQCEPSPVSASVQQLSDNQPALKKKNGKRCSKRTPSRVETVQKKIKKKKTARLEAKENSTFALPSS